MRRHADRSLPVAKSVVVSANVVPTRSIDASISDTLYEIFGGDEEETNSYLFNAGRISVSASAVDLASLDQRGAEGTDDDCIADLPSMGLINEYEADIPEHEFNSEIFYIHSDGTAMLASGVTPALTVSDDSPRYIDDLLNVVFGAEIHNDGDDVTDQDESSECGGRVSDQDEYTAAFDEALDTMLLDEMRINEYAQSPVTLRQRRDTSTTAEEITIRSSSNSLYDILISVFGEGNIRQIISDTISQSSEYNWGP